MTNHLAAETSPYLLQHKDNPVAWRPWGEDALAEARASGKPILLSVGYAACHWCHVMAHESFENSRIAQAMNAGFICIKVDREERPDLDAIYQQALSMMGQHGGWPLTMFLTPAGEPFWGGTYFPPEARYGRPGFPDVLRAVLDAWTNAPDKVKDNVTALLEGLEHQSASPGAAPLTLDMLDSAARQLLRAIDTDHGGLQGAPKFPQPGIFDLLWRAWLRTGDLALRDAVTLTLDHMSHGGIYDHLGGGFMRYSTDELWLVPHFEKMLYDNAQLIDLLTLAWQGTGTPLYKQRVDETVEWVLRDMTAEGGAFAATVDADSEGGEGRFYLWTTGEVDRALDPDTATWFKQAYDLRPEGNWEGATILHRNHQPQPVGVEEELAAARAVLWRTREGRAKPARDDKILADWNGMMIAALANAGLVFDMPRWTDAARTAFETVAVAMALPDGRLAHSMRFGRVSSVGLLDDLAHMARAALALYEATGDDTLVTRARDWVAAADRHYWDTSGGGYFQTAADAPDLILRPKPIHDSAVPAANGVMAQVLARLWLVTGDDGYRRRAEETIAAFSALAGDQFPNMTSLMAAFEQLAAPLQIVVAGEPAEDLVRAVADLALPTRVLERVNGTGLPPGHPAHGKGAVDGRATAYVCRGNTCSPPVSDPARLREMLSPR